MALLRSTAGGYAARVGSTSQSIRFSNAPITEGQFPGWQPIAAEEVSGSNSLLWRNQTAGQLVTWNLDSSWNWSSSNPVVAINSSGALALESSFGLDLNGDSL
ncbi:hypothetical protein, partial [Synechococcus sp. CCY 0621]|uniref:hypothetical protein n=1 Tax=Synechococcus sp. CCY 0621 TaxID=2815603 RepID=UPI00336AAC74